MFAFKIIITVLMAIFSIVTLGTVFEDAEKRGGTVVLLLVLVSAIICMWN